MSIKKSSNRKLYIKNKITNRSTQNITRKITKPVWLFFIFISASLIGCGGSSSDSGSGYLQIYNASKNSPPIFMTVDDKSYTGLSFGQSGGLYTYDTDKYEIELAWQDGENSYENLYESEVDITDEDVMLVVVSGDINTPDILTYSYEMENPEDDDEEFTLRFLNMHDSSNGVDVYMSKGDETFNEAVQVGQFSFGEMSDSQYFEVENYKFYLTLAGSSEVTYQSEEIPFLYTTQYVMVIKENVGPGDSLFMLDKLSKSTSAVEYPDEQSGAEFRVYNGLRQHDLLPNFNNEIDLYLDGIDDSAEVLALTQGSFSPSMSQPFGDYGMDLTNGDAEDIIAKNLLLTLSANSDKTVFFYLKEVEEEDNDDDTENEISLYINSLVSDNSNRISLYDHQIKLINLIDEYAGVTVYFVRNNETIADTPYSVYNNQANPASFTLLNNTYDVYVVVKEGDSDLILINQEITLDENSGDLYLVLEQDVNTSTGYKLLFAPQNDDATEE